MRLPLASPSLEFQVVEAAEELFKADHYDHFETRMSDSEMKALNNLRSALAAVRSGEGEKQG